MITNVLWVNNRIVSFQSKIIFFLENITFPNTRKSFYFPKSWFLKSADFKPIAILNTPFLNVFTSSDPHFSKKYDLELRFSKQNWQTRDKWFLTVLRNAPKIVSPVVDGPLPEKEVKFFIFWKKYKSIFCVETIMFLNVQKCWSQSKMKKTYIFHENKSKIDYFEKLLFVEKSSIFMIFLGSVFGRKTSKTVICLQIPLVVPI